MNSLERAAISTGDCGEARTRSESSRYWRRGEVGYAERVNFKYGGILLRAEQTGPELAARVGAFEPMSFASHGTHNPEPVV